jgi:hypothetical protein
VALLAVLTLRAAGADAPAPRLLAERFKAAASPEPEHWVQAMYALSDPEGRDVLRAAIVTRTPFPRAELVKLLTDPRLAVRLGALDLLEEAAGGTFDYIPWSGPGEDPRNTEPLRPRWSRRSVRRALVPKRRRLPPARGARGAWEVSAATLQLLAPTASTALRFPKPSSW